MRRHEYRLRQTELRRGESDRWTDAPHQGAGDDLPSGPLPDRARGEFAKRAAARSGDHDDRLADGPAVRIGKDPEPAANTAARRRLMGTYREGGYALGNRCP